MFIRKRLVSELIRAGKEGFELSQPALDEINQALFLEQHLIRGEPLTWFDFDKKQTLDRRSLSSALQLPVYCVRTDQTKDMKGVLCLDSDQPDTFLSAEVELWLDELVGFLVNLALAEKLRECGA